MSDVYKYMYMNTTSLVLINDLKCNLEARLTTSRPRGIVTPVMRLMSMSIYNNLLPKSFFNNESIFFYNTIKTDCLFINAVSMLTHRRMSTIERVGNIILEAIHNKWI